MSDLERDKMGILKIDGCNGEQAASCGAVDLRDCSMMKHIILAEIRRSNAPAWVAEEVDRKLKCHSCCMRMKMKPVPRDLFKRDLQERLVKP